MNIQGTFPTLEQVMVSYDDGPITFDDAREELEVSFREDESYMRTEERSWND